MRRTTALLITLLVTVAAPALVQGKGIGLDDVLVGPSGVASQDGAWRYVTLNPFETNSTLAKIETTTGKVVRYRSPGGSLRIPAVAHDGTPGGLSADGSTLALVRAYTEVPPKQTHLRIIDTAKLTTRRAIDLPGWFSFDAISPDGSRVFLIRYTSGTDWSKYEVRALDTASGRLLPLPIVDAREPTEVMTGVPATRVTSADGRWAYTLYARERKQPFVHALDTVAGVAHCIDIPVDLDSGAVLAGPTEAVVSPPDGTALTLTKDGRSLVVSGQGGAPAMIDLERFVATAASTATPPEDGAPWAAIATTVGGALLLGATGLLWRRRRRSHAAPASIGR